jgi:hypothetical protein
LPLENKPPPKWDARPDGRPKPQQRRSGRILRRVISPGACTSLPLEARRARRIPAAAGVAWINPEDDIPDQIENPRAARCATAVEPWALTRTTARLGRGTASAARDHAGPNTPIPVVGPHGILGCLRRIPVHGDRRRRLFQNLARSRRSDHRRCWRRQDSAVSCYGNGQRQADGRASRPPWRLHVLRPPTVVLLLSLLLVQSSFSAFPLRSLLSLPQFLRSARKAETANPPGGFHFPNVQNSMLDLASRIGLKHSWLNARHFTLPDSAVLRAGSR